jgi:hypothetical protein
MTEKVKLTQVRALQNFDNEEQRQTSQ